MGFGADLAVETLVDAYRRGIFPWPHPAGPLPWFSPDPRASRRGRRGGRVQVAAPAAAAVRLDTTVDAAFDEVVAACAEPSAGEGTWIRRHAGRLRPL